MPELPEIETIKRALAPRLRGARLKRVCTRRPDLRFPLPEDFAIRLQGRRIDSVKRRGKYLLLALCAARPYPPDILFIHLGMSGRVLFLPRPAVNITAHDHVVFHLNGGPVLLYRDPRRFGYMGIVAQTALAQHPRFAHLGIEPLGRGLTTDWLRQHTQTRQLSLKALLLQQSLLVGVGNIYANEALFQARLHPTTLCACLDDKQRRRLITALQSVLRRAIDAGGSSLGKGQSNFVAATGDLGYFQLCFAVYGRAGEPCRRRYCKGVVQQFTQNGRSSYACPLCQI